MNNKNNKINSNIQTFKINYKTKLINLRSKVNQKLQIIREKINKLTIKVTSNRMGKTIKNQKLTSPKQKNKYKVNKV